MKISFKAPANAGSNTQHSKSQIILRAAVAAAVSISLMMAVRFGLGL